MNLINIHDKWTEKRYDQIISLLDFNPAAKVIDLGCDNGQFSLKIKEKVGCKDMYGMEIPDEVIEYAKKNGLNVVKGDLNQKLVLPDQSFDIIVTNQVIEHLLYPTQFLKEIKRILRYKGIAIISTENLSSWDNIISLTLGWTPFSMHFDEFAKIGNPVSPHNNEEIDNYIPHTRIFTYRGLKDTCEQIGLRVDQIKGSGYIPFNFISDFDKCHSRFLTIRVRK